MDEESGLEVIVATSAMPKNTCSNNVKHIHSGQELVPFSRDSTLFQTSTGNPVLKLSRAFSTHLQAYLDKDYLLEQIHARYIVVWKDKETGEQLRVVLPKLRLCRRVTHESD